MSDIFYKTVPDRLEMLWSTQPDKHVMIFYDDLDLRTALTNTHVQDLSRRCAAYLAAHGVRKGDVVCNMLAPSLEKEILNFGILLAGGVVMEGHVIDEEEHFWQTLEQAEVAYIVLSPEPEVLGWRMVKADVGLTDADVEVMTRSHDTGPSVRKVFKFHIAHRVKYFQKTKYKSAFDIFRAYTGHYAPVQVHPHDRCYIMVAKDDNYYRLVERDHISVIKIGRRLEGMLGCTSADVIYDDHPLSWIPGLPFHYITLGATFVRSSLGECPDRKVVVDTWKLIESEKITMAALTFSMLQMLTSQCDDLPQPHHMLRVLTTNGHGELARSSMLDALGVITSSMVMCYSCIEAGLVARHVVDESNRDSYVEGLVGEHVSPHDNRHVSARPSHVSNVGEIVLEGALVVKEYLNDEYLTKDAFTEDGFFRTGDVGFYNELGQLFILGRKSDAIFRENIVIFPRDIEVKVNECPGVWKVKVVSVKDERGVVQLCACVVPRRNDAPSIEEIQEHLRYQLGGSSENDDAPHVPNFVFFFQSFPTTAGGVVNRKMLGYMASEILRDNPKLS